MNENEEKRIALVAVIILAALLLVVGCLKIARIVRTAVNPSFDLGKLVAAETAQDGAVTIGNDSYAPLCRAVYGDEHIAVGQADVIAYRSQLGGVGQITYLEYFARIDELPSGSWLVSFYEDGSGKATPQTLLTIYRKVGTVGVPGWVEKMAAQAKDQDAASRSDLAGVPAE